MNTKQTLPAKKIVFHSYQAQTLPKKILIRCDLMTNMKKINIVNKWIPVG